MTSTWAMAWRILEPPQRRMAWVVLVLMIVAAMAAAMTVGAVFPFLSVLSDPSRIERVPQLAWVYQRFGFESRQGFMVALGAATLVVIVVANLLQVLRTYAVLRFTQLTGHGVSCRVLASYLRQPYAFFLSRHSGTMATSVLAESTQVIREFFGPAANLIASALTSLAVVAVVVWVDPVVSVVAIGVFGVIYLLIFRLVRNLTARLGRERLAANRQRFRMANEPLTGIKDIKILGHEHRYLDRFSHPSHRLAQIRITTGVIGNLPRYLMQAVAFGGVILLCLILIDLDASDGAEPLARLLPTLGVFALAAQKLMPELSTLYQSFVSITAARATVETIHEDLTQAARLPELSAGTVTPMGLRQSLELDRISYSYPNAERPGLVDVSVTIRAGERIGIVGSTGAGKTTLADLVLGLLTPDSGRLLCDGRPITPANLRAWQRSLGYVPQEIFLSDASVAENIALGIEPAQIDHARVEAAARIARIDGFVRQDLPQGYRTEVGERGVRLSGGQRQRIGIARALYHDADLIVFDEATSALDNLTEAEVMAAVEALPGEKTVMMIAHRLSTVRRCDRIMVLDRGHLVGCGTWDDLMRDSPEFRSIVEASQGPSPDSASTAAPDA